MTTFVIEPSPHRAGFYRLLGNIPSDLLPVLRSTVGVVKSAGIWIVPQDIARAICRIDLPSSIAPIIDETSQLYPYQQRAVTRALNQKRLLINFKPGLGKSPTAIEVMKRARIASALIVCPAIVRDTWAQEFTKWAPKMAHEVQIIETGKEAELANAPIIVVSYELAAKVPSRDWSAVIIDESHYCKTPESKRSKEIAQILAAAPKSAFRLFLTGTPIANEPIDLHHQVELLYPGLWGSRAAFQRYYCRRRENAYTPSGWEYYGVNDEHAEELHQRIDWLSITATEKEVAGLLPPITFQSIHVKPSRAFDLRSYLDNFDRRDVHLSRGAENSIRACGREKLEHTIDLVRDSLASGSTHVSVMTHLKATAREIGDALAGEGVLVTVVTGDNTHKKRHAEITRLASAPRAVFVGTMHSIGIGINELVAFPDVIYAELDYRPDEVVQSMKRYHRISGKENVRIRVLVLEGTLEERVARSVARKLRDQNMVLDVGTMAKALEDELEMKMDDATFFARCQETAAKMVERDVYT